MDVLTTHNGRCYARPLMSCTMGSNSSIVSNTESLIWPFLAFAQSYRVTSLKNVTLRMSEMGSPKSPWGYGCYIADSNPDLYSNRNIRSITGFQTLLYKRLPNVRSFSQCHTRWLNWCLYCWSVSWLSAKWQNLHLREARVSQKLTFYLGTFLKKWYLYEIFF